MSYKAKGKIVVLNEAVQVTEKFKKREFVIQEEEEIHGNVYTNLMPMQFVNDGCAKLDSFAVGQEVEVTFHPKGSRWESPDKQDPSIIKSGYNLNLVATAIMSLTPPPTPAPAPPAQGAPAPASGLPF